MSLVIYNGVSSIITVSKNLELEVVDTAINSDGICYVCESLSSHTCVRFLVDFAILCNESALPLVVDLGTADLTRSNEIKKLVDYG